jgi:hypothetical protein
MLLVLSLWCRPLCLSPAVNGPLSLVACRVSSVQSSDFSRSADYSFECFLSFELGVVSLVDEIGSESRRKNTMARKCGNL